MKHRLVNSVIKEDYVRTLLKERGIEDVDRFLNPTWEDIQSPLELTNMKEGVELLASILEIETPHICLIVDCDVDGFTSSSIMYQYIKAINSNTDITYILHEKKQHGLSDCINKILDSDITYDLVLIPDAASNDFEYTEKLKAHNIPVLILDHHILESEVSTNVVLINNQASENYRNKDLSGAGVAWQFCRAYDEFVGFEIAQAFTDLAALGIIGDMMGLNEIENQAIIKFGLGMVNNQFFRYLIEKQDFSMGGKLNPTTVAFYIVPMINAMIRVGSMDEKKRLFEAFVNPEKIVPCNKRGAKGTTEKVYIESARECTNAKSKQDREKEKIVGALEAKIFKHDLLENKILFIRLDDDDEFPSELNGLVAMQLASRYSRPTIVARLNDEGMVRGSARGLNESSLTSFKDFLNQSGLFEYTAGHDNAFGISVPNTALDKLHEYANDALKDMDLSESAFDVNFERHAMDSDLKNLIYDIAEYEDIYGQKMTEPLIYVDSINLKQGEWRVMGQRKDTVSWEKNGVKYIQFHAADLIEELNQYPEVQIEIVGRATLNEWMGNVSPQIMVKSYEIKNGQYAF